MDEFEVVGATDKEMKIRHRATGHEWDVWVGFEDGRRFISPSGRTYENDDADPAASELAVAMKLFAEHKMRRAGMIDP